MEQDYNYHNRMKVKQSAYLKTRPKFRNILFQSALNAGGSE